MLGVPGRTCLDGFQSFLHIFTFSPCLISLQHWMSNSIWSQFSCDPMNIHEYPWIHFEIYIILHQLSTISHPTHPNPSRIAAAAWATSRSCARCSSRRPCAGRASSSRSAWRSRRWPPRSWKPGVRRRDGELDGELDVVEVKISEM